MYAQVGDEFISVDQLAEDATLDLNAPAEDEAVSPQLINFAQWIQCFSLNDANTHFANYYAPWNGTTPIIRLTCGTESYGYKHIRNGKESQWQKILDYATPLGMFPDKSWDDVMSIGTGVALQYPDFVTDKPGNKRCAIGTTAWVVDGAIQWSFETLAVWSTDALHIITAYPRTGNSHC